VKAGQTKLNPSTLVVLRVASAQHSKGGFNVSWGHPGPSVAWAVMLGATRWGTLPRTNAASTSVMVDWSRGESTISGSLIDAQKPNCDTGDSRAYVFKGGLERMFAASNS
jgi:hypothetical protein